MSNGSFSFKIELQDDALDVELLSPSSVVAIVARVSCDRIPISEGNFRGNDLVGVEMDESINPRGNRASSKEK